MSLQNFVGIMEENHNPEYFFIDLFGREDLERISRVITEMDNERLISLFK